jgi:glycosyltransferase involved in cell wall biosynthesis
MANGYIPHLIGIDRDLPFGEYEVFQHNGITCYGIRYAGTVKEKFLDQFYAKKTLVRILEDIGVDRIRCFIMQDYQLSVMKGMERYCKKHGIAFVADIMDWFTPTKDYSVAKNILKTLDTVARMRVYYPFVRNKIYISHTFADQFRDAATRNVAVIPCTSVDDSRELRERLTDSEAPQIVFAGFPGKKFEKEKIDWIIRALYENQSRIGLHVIGLSEEECISRSEDLRAFLTEHIHFYGRIPRGECLEILSKCDFSIVARKVNKLTTYGFASKICEAFAFGIPVLATDNSDNRLYIRNGETGFVCGADYESLKELLGRIDALPLERIRYMHERLTENNPLGIQCYTEQFGHFMDHLRL